MGWKINLWTLFKRSTQDKLPPKVKLELFDEWLEEEFNRRSKDPFLSVDIPHYINKIKDQRWFLECLLDKWQEKIDGQVNERREQILTIFSQTRELLEVIAFPEKDDFFAVVKVNKNLEKKVEYLLNLVEKSFFAQNYSFLLSPEEREHFIMNPLLQGLIELRGTQDAFEQKILRSGLRTIETLARKYGVVAQRFDKRKELLLELQITADKLRQARLKEDEKKKNLQELRSQVQNTEMKEISLEREKIDQKLTQLDQEIKSTFSAIEPAIQSYLGQYPGQGKGLLKKYLQDPLETFQADEHLAIQHLLRHLKALLDLGKLEVASSSLPQLQKSLGELLTGKLEKLASLRANALRNKEDLQKKISRSLFLVKLEDAEYRLSHFAKLVNDLEQITGDIQEKIDELEEQITKERDFLQNLVKLGLSRELELTLDFTDSSLEV